jgi:predicted RecB family nuclease
MSTKITRDVLESYLHCAYKGHLKLAGEQGSPSDYEVLQRVARSRVRQAAAERLMCRHQEGDILRSVTLTRPLLQQGVPLLLDATVEDRALSIHFDALLRAAGPSRLGDFHYRPVVFHEAERPRRQQKELLELYGAIIGVLQGRQPDSGVLIHGQGCTVRRLKLNPSGQRAQRVLQEIKELQRTGTPPQLTLNSHCQMCEFRQRCHAQAAAADDLSLLGGLSAKEIRKYHRKGIFTVTQLSCTFRPRRRRKRTQPKSRPHHPALQALAIRDQKIYVLGTPRLPDATTRLYLDLEGHPDRQSAYLLGLIVEGNGVEERHSFWADRPSEEPRLVQQLLDVVGRLDDFALYTYGSYEATVLRRMFKRSGHQARGERMLARLVNVLSLVHAHVYFPVYSNGLKHIGRYLGCEWTDPNASSLQSIVWRTRWEETGSADFKDRLTTYNLEDCVALRTVTEFLYSLCRDQPGLPPSPTVASAEHAVSRVEEIDPAASRPLWRRQTFALPDFAFIHERASFDYQRDKIFIRTNKALQRRRARKRGRKGTKHPYVNRSVAVTSEACPQCGGTELTRRPHGRLHRLAYDLRFTRSGIRRWVTRLTTAWHECRRCNRRFLPRDYLRVDVHFHSLKSWAMQEHVAHRASFAHIAEKLRDYYGVPVSPPDVHAFQARLAGYYAETYQRLLAKLVGGAVLHADETGVHVKGAGNGYVWVFTNMEEVVYMYRQSREGGFLHELFGEFRGVLISDFYAAYDSLACAQQKCLVHLIRDINRDIQASPWDEELKALAAALGGVLRPIMVTVDRYGLRQRHLAKHRREVARFFRTIAGAAYRSEVADGYRQRLLQYQAKLFTFLDHDGVPWNNNNAEHAVHRFAYYREIADGLFSPAGLNDYLVLLSIYQTCRYKEVGFLPFLLSQEKDIDAYGATAHRRRQLPTIELCPEGFTFAHRYPTGGTARSSGPVAPL